MTISDLNGFKCNYNILTIINSVIVIRMRQYIKIIDERETFPGEQYIEDVVYQLPSW